MAKACGEDIEQLRYIKRGYFPGRSPDIVMTPKEPHYFGTFSITSHSGPWDYLQQVPLVFYGPGHIRPLGDLELDREVTLADLAPTLARMLGIDLPDASGRAIEEILEPGAAAPKLILVVVWDGGGWNVLNQWPDTWPHLRSLMDRGASITDAVVGSSPSVTPAIHATIGTGVFPNRHGIVDIPMREGDKIVDSFAGNSPERLEVQTVGDIYDLSTGNDALVGMHAERSWHLGMLGHGAAIEGGDKDYAVMMEGQAGELSTSDEFYSLPEYLLELPGLDRDTRRVDLEDGVVDDTWQGHPVLDDPEKLTNTPAWTLYQSRLIKELFEREGFGTDDVPDLFYTNFKQIDYVGHIYNLIHPEMESTLRFTDDALERLTKYLDEKIGRDGWVLAMTADHGQGQDPKSAGVWPIAIDELKVDLALRFGARVDDLIQIQRPTGLWLDRAELARLGTDEQEIANWLLRYRIRDNVTDDQRVPEQYEPMLGQRIFSSAFPYAFMGKVWSCAADGL